MINVDSLITDLKCLGEVAETEDIRVEGNPLHAWVNESWQALEFLQQQLADMERKLEAAEKDADRYRWIKENDNAYLLPEDVIDDAIVQRKGENDA